MTSAQTDVDALAVAPATLQLRDTAFLDAVTRGGRRLRRCVSL